MVDVDVSGTGHDAQIRVSPGGSAANSAVWAASLGARATVIGRVGDDLAGEALRAALAGRGVVAAIDVDPEQPTGTFLTVDGEIRADPGANAQLSPAHLPGEIDADVLLVSGYLPAETVVAALARARAGWVALVPGRLDELPDGPTAVVANEQEARRLTGLDAEEAARELGRRVRLACVTRGPLGAFAVLDGRLEAVAASSTTARDSVGAGDAFAAGLFVALARGGTLIEALGEGARCGEQAAGRAGAWP